MSAIDDYIEWLYEEINDKVKSTRHILQLAKIPENMPMLIQNGIQVNLESLMSALSRVLREDGKRSMELVTNIVYIFFCFSNFSEFHAIITANKIGDMCLRIADQELKRFDIWIQDVQTAEAKAKQSPSDKTILAELEMEHKKFQNRIRKQDQLLFVSFHVLLNLAEDLSIEVKMIKRDIIKYLIHLLDRQSPEIHVLNVMFLKKLSVFKENKDEMLRQGPALLKKLAAFMNSKQKTLAGLVMRLLLNLSHDVGFRAQMVKCGILDTAVKMFQEDCFSVINLQLLYQLSIDDKHRSQSIFEECMPPLIRMILEYKGEKVNTEVMALAINLSTLPTTQKWIVQEGGLRFLIKRGLKTRDTLLFKMLRNISQSPEINIKIKFLDFIDDLMSLLVNSAHQSELLVELLGLMGNLVIPDFDFVKLAENYDLINFCAGLLSKYSTSTGGIGEDDDILLETVIFIGTMTQDENIPALLIKTPIISLLIQVMSSKEEDDEMILQVCYCIYQFLLQEATCKYLIAKTQIVNVLIDLLYDRNNEIRKICDAALSVIGVFFINNRKLMRIGKRSCVYKSFLGTMPSGSPLLPNPGKPTALLMTMDPFMAMSREI